MSKKATKVKAPASEGKLLSIGVEQRSVADRVNHRVSPLATRLANKDDTATLRSGASAGQAKAMGQVLATAASPTERANAIIAGNSAKAQALNGAAATGASSRLTKMGDYVAAQSGTAQAATQSLSNLNQMNSQNAINAMQRKQQQQSALFGMAGSIVGSIHSGVNDYKSNQVAATRHSELLAAMGGGG